ncbi:hypothetical protein ACTG9Q_08880 [Actinokineospora sp. 24-640]
MVTAQLLAGLTNADAHLPDKVAKHGLVSTKESDLREVRGW